MLLVCEQELTGLIAQQGDFIVRDDTFAIEAEYTVEIVAASHAVVSLGNMLVKIGSFPVEGNVLLVPRTFYREAIFFAIRLIQF